MQNLPPVIRAYLAQGKYTTVAKNLMTKYGLRVDQAGVLERETMLLLMGIENPDEFMQTLIEEAKLDKKIVDGIVQDVNMQIFIPLRQEEMKGERIHLENKISLHPALAAPQAAPHSLKAIGGAAHLVAIASPKALNNKMLEDHEEPHIEFTNMAPPLRARTAPPPPNLPGAMPSVTTANSQPLPPNKISQPPVPPPRPPVKPYSIDPYREPIDEK